MPPSVLNARLDNDVLQLGSGTPNIDPPTLMPLWKIISRLGQQQDPQLLNYDNVYGVAELREQITRLMFDSGSQLVADDVIITTVCHEALLFSIRAICQAGDIVAVESPAFHGTMQTLRGSGSAPLRSPPIPSAVSVLKRWS